MGIDFLLIQRVLKKKNEKLFWQTELGRQLLGLGTQCFREESSGGSYEWMGERDLRVRRVKEGPPNSSPALSFSPTAYLGPYTSWPCEPPFCWLQGTLG